jgi:hypothetical protein
LSAGKVGAKKYALLAKDSNTPKTYRWVKSNNNNLTSSFDRSTFHFAAYGMRGCDFVTNYLVFDNSVVRDRKQETKIFSLRDDSALTFSQRLQALELSDAILDKFTEYVKQGFKVTDIFYSDGFKLILSRK